MSLISPREALSLLSDNKAVLIDVRTSKEFESEHIPYAVSIPLDDLEQAFEKWHLADDRTILFQCQKGKRGELACEFLEQFPTFKQKVLNIEGGIDGWKQAGLPVIGKAELTHEISIFRQFTMVIGSMLLLLSTLAYNGLTPALIIIALLGLALLTAGLTGWCGLTLLLAKMPWNTPKKGANTCCKN
jgi:rhodanese-related sulfurtransferase